MNLKDSNQIFKILSSNNPTPKTELNYNNKFTLAIAVILSAQSTDIAVNKATQKLFIKYNTAEKMLQLGENNLKSYIKTIGLFNIKARNIIKLSNMLIKDYQGKIPNTFEKLITLPGIGMKTANVILNCAFNKKTIAIDTHVYRVAHRLGFTTSTSLKIIEKDLLTKIANKWLHHAHNWLVLHGRYICKAKDPKCLSCAIKKFCLYYNSNSKN